MTILRVIIDLPVCLMPYFAIVLADYICVCIYTERNINHPHLDLQNMAVY